MRQTIDSAPKDGTAALLYTPSGIIEASWQHGEWADFPVYATYDRYSGVALCCLPKHWQPLPAAPDQP